MLIFVNAILLFSIFPGSQASNTFELQFISWFITFFGWNCAWIRIPIENVYQWISCSDDYWIVLHINVNELKLTSGWYKKMNILFKWIIIWIDLKMSMNKISMCSPDSKLYNIIIKPDKWINMGLLFTINFYRKQFNLMHSWLWRETNLIRLHMMQKMNLILVKA